MVLLVVVSNIFYFHPYLGKISNLTNILQMGGSTTNQFWFNSPDSRQLLQRAGPSLTMKASKVRGRKGCRPDPKRWHMIADGKRLRLHIFTQMALFFSFWQKRRSDGHMGGKKYLGILWKNSMMHQIYLGRWLNNPPSGPKKKHRARRLCELHCSDSTKFEAGAERGRWNRMGYETPRIELRWTMIEPQDEWWMKPDTDIFYVFRV